eukprot:jgi/Tetstr1/458910/TSEL_000376.t1
MAASVNDSSHSANAAVSSRTRRAGALRAPTATVLRRHRLRAPVRAVLTTPPAAATSSSNDTATEKLSSAVSSARLKAQLDTVAAASCDTEAVSEQPGVAASAEPAEKQGGGKFSGSLKGMALLNIGAALFGSNQVAIKSAEASCGPGLLSAVRFTTAAICFAPSTIRGFADPVVRGAAMELGVYLTGGYVGQAYGLTQTSATHGALTGTFTVIAVPMFVGLSGTKVSKSTWFSAMLAIMGVALLTTDNTTPNIGDLWCVMSACVFGLHKFRSELITRSMPDKTKELMATQLSVLALGSIGAAAVEMHAGGQGLSGALEQVSSLPLPNLLYMGVATTALTLWIEMESLKEVSAPLAALIYTTEPLWGAGFAYALLGDRWGPQGWVGGGLIVAASLLSQVLEGLGAPEAEEGDASKEA